ncbi:hypothetical protein JCGZ_19640 [Jatropha curcas]|uniref:S-protein homolog n=1 Tax=Jatropha curcas TaxID=180498 RepID=A0A067K5V7_JATCU|nr:hypothetical protein JCGZ_19640 [Jatropha curcas]
MRQPLKIFLGLAISSFFFATSTSIIDNHRDEATTVYIINGLPKSSETMQVRCSSKSTSPDPRSLDAGEEYNWTVKEKGMYKCYSVWREFFQVWHAFQPRRDRNYREVFWVVKEDGFYLSWNNSSWVRKAIWESE